MRSLGVSCCRTDIFCDAPMKEFSSSLIPASSMSCDTGLRSIFRSATCQDVAHCCGEAIRTEGGGNAQTRVPAPCQLVRGHLHRCGHCMRQRLRFTSATEQAVVDRQQIASCAYPVTENQPTARTRGFMHY